jgi:hypothetical protein
MISVGDNSLHYWNWDEKEAQGNRKGKVVDFRRAWVPE